MCVIAAKAAGVPMPTYDIIDNMFFRNPNGAGIMWAADGTVHIEKGFMTLDAFYNALFNIQEKYDLDKLPVVMHFRITTHGGTSPENCHPFPISEANGMLKKLTLKTDVGVAHNGIIDIRCEKGLSDTMTYIKEQMAPLKQAVPDFYKNKHLLKMIENAIDSRMAILDKKGEITLIGDFVEDQGIKYSNTSYKAFRLDDGYKFQTCGCDYTDWELYDGYGQYGHKIVMWLDDDQWAEDYNGEVFYDAAIDKDGRVYVYEDAEGALVPLEGGIAFDEKGEVLKFNPEGYVIDELVLEVY